MSLSVLCSSLFLPLSSSIPCSRSQRIRLLRATWRLARGAGTSLNPLSDPPSSPLLFWFPYSGPFFFRFCSLHPCSRLRARCHNTQRRWCLSAGASASCRALPRLLQLSAIPAASDKTFVYYLMHPLPFRHVPDSPGQSRAVPKRPNKTLAKSDAEIIFG